MSHIIVFLLVMGTMAYFVSKRPDEFRVTRTAEMNAAPAVVFEQINHLTNWEAWSPWAKLDPTAHTIYEGPASGVGAISRWDGNRKVGQGSMTITQSRPNEFIQFQLDFLKPMKATNTAEFIFTPQGNQTTVTWTMYGKSNFMGKLMSLVFNCEKMVGGQFEQGLASLKAIVEK